MNDEIQKHLRALEDRPDDEAALTALEEAVVGNGSKSAESPAQLLEAARRLHVERGDFETAVRLLDMEIVVAGSDADREVELRTELARLLSEEVFDDKRAVEEHQAILKLRPDHDASIGAVERIRETRENWKKIAEKFLETAETATDSTLKTDLFQRVSELYLKNKPKAKEVETYLRRALEVEPKNRRAAAILERVLRRRGKLDELCALQEQLAQVATNRDDKIGALLAAGRTASEHLGDRDRAAKHYAAVLELAPGNPVALRMLVAYYTDQEDWDHLVALYEDALKGRGRTESEQAILLQIGMTHWRMRADAAAAEPYFHRLRKAEPTHPVVLEFYRDFHTKRGEEAKLVQILTDAQRLVRDNAAKIALGAEIARLAETQLGNVERAIDAWKAIQRLDPTNTEAPGALKRLYERTEKWNALLDVLKAEAEALPADARAARIAILGQVVAIYRDKLQLDVMVINTYNSILAIDPGNAEALESLSRTFETMGRWSDLITVLQRRADAESVKATRVELLERIATLWVERFANYNQATRPLEEILEADPGNAPALEKLKDIYQKKRSWKPLFDVLGKQAELTQGPARTVILVELARLAAERIEKPAQAIALWSQVLEADPAAPGALDALEKLTEKERDWKGLARVIERRLAAGTADPEESLRLLVKLGEVRADKLEDPELAAKTWKRVLEIRPNHARAGRVLRELYVATARWDELGAMYSATKDWEGLVDVLGTAADRTSDPKTKVDLSFRAAAVYQEKIGAPDRALRSYERVISVEPQNLEAAAALVPIYEREERWARLQPIYELLLKHAAGKDEAVAWTVKIRDLCGSRLGDKTGAYLWAERCYELAPTDASIRAQLEKYAGEADALDDLVRAFEKRAAVAPAKEKRAIERSIAKLELGALGKTDAATARYERMLAEGEDEDGDVLSQLETIYRATGRHEALVAILDRRLARTKDPAGRRELEIELARIAEDELGSAAEAARRYREIVAEDPKDDQALAALERLALGAHSWDELATILARRRDLRQGPERAGLGYRLAKILIERQKDHRGGLDELRRVLELVPDHAEAAEALEKLMDDPDLRLEIAVLLEPYWERADDSRMLARSVEIRLEASQDPRERRALYDRLTDLAAGPLGDGPRALELGAKAFAEDPAGEGLVERLVMLGEALDATDKVTAILADRVRAGLDPELDRELSARVAELYAGELGQPDAAEEFYLRVLGADENASRPFEALEQHYSAKERWNDLRALYDRRIAATLDAAGRVELYGKLAFLYEEVTDDFAAAIEVHEKILEIDPEHGQPSEASLEKLYDRTGRHRDLVGLLSRQLARAGEPRPSRADSKEAVELRYRLGDLHERRLDDPAGAVDYYSDVLSQDPKHLGAQAALERLVQNGSLRQRVAAILEPLYDRQGAALELARILEVQLEEVADPSARVALLGRIAEIREKRLGDPAGAFDAWARAVTADPADLASRKNLARLAQTLGCEAKETQVLASILDQTATDVSLHASVLSDIARLHEERLGDPAEAEKHWRRLFELDSGDPTTVLPAAVALERLYLARGAFKDLVEILGARARFAEDPREKRQLYLRIAEARETVLDDAPGAIETYRSILDLDALDLDALGALERLYERTGAWSDLVGVLRIRVDVAVGGERKELHYRIAEIYERQLGDLDNAIAQYNTVLDETRRTPAAAPPVGDRRTLMMSASADDRETLARLTSLYEKTERWGDLLETLEQDLVLERAGEWRSRILERMGAIHEDRTKDPAGAVDAYRRAIEEDRTREPSRSALERIAAAGGDAHLAAARVLAPLYDADGDFGRLVGVLELEAQSATDPLERARFLRRAADAAEKGMADFARAFDLCSRAARDAASDAEISDVLDVLDRLAERTGRERDLAALYQDLAPEVLDAGVQVRLYLTVAELARKRLADPKLARELYGKVLDLRADHKGSLDALEGLCADAGDHAALLDILRRKAELAVEPWARRDLVTRQAQLLEGPLGDASAAIDAYEAVFTLDENDKEATSALERLYAAAERWSDLLNLLERLRAQPGADRVALSYRIGEIRLRQGEPDLAIEDFVAALGRDAQHAPTIALLESLMSQPERRATVARILEPVYLARMDWPKVVSTLEARIEAEDDPTERRQLLLRLGTMHEEHLEDLEAAFETFARLFREDVGNADTWDLLQRLGRILEKPARVAEVWEAGLDGVVGDTPDTARLAYLTAQIHDERTGDVAKARALYRRAYDFDPSNGEVSFALERLLLRTTSYADLVELYRDQASRATDPVERKAHLTKIATVYDEVLSDGPKAIEAYREIRDADPTDATIAAHLERLYTKLESWDDLAEHLLGCLVDARSTSERVAIEHQLGCLYDEKLKNVSVALDHFEGALTLDGTHAPTIAALERLVLDVDYRYRIARLLEPIYKAADEWRKLVVIYDAELQFINDRDERVGRLREIARIHEARGGDLKLAYRALARGFAEDPANREILGELERLATMLGLFGDLVADLEKGRESSFDAELQVEILAKIATIHDQRLGDPRAAIEAYRRILGLDEDNAAAVEALEALHMLIGDWEGLVRILGDKADHAKDDASRKRDLYRIAEILEDLIGDPARAVRAHERVLEVDPMDTASLVALDRLHQTMGAWAELVPVLRRRIESGRLERDERREILARIATTLEKELHDNQEAIVAWRGVTDDDPHDGEALAALDGLYQKEGMWPELLENLETRAQVAPGPAHRVPFLQRMGALLERELGELDRAIECYQDVLAVDSGDSTAVEALTRIARDETHRMAAAAVLDPVLTEARRWSALEELLELELELSVDPKDRVALLVRIAKIAEEGRQDGQRAFDVLVRALAEEPSNDQLAGEIERLAPVAAGWGKAADALAERADAVLDSQASRALYLRTGRIAETRLGDDQRAIGAYCRALECGGDEAEALGALDRLYEKTGRHAELAEILERRAGQTLDGREAAELEYRLGELREEKFGEPAMAVSAYRAVLEREPTHPGALAAFERLVARPETRADAIEVLEPLYRSRAELRKLAALYSAKIEIAGASSERIALWAELGALEREDLDDLPAAFEAFGEAFALDPSEPAMLDEMAAIAAKAGNWAELCQRVEKAAASEDLDPVTARDLNLRAARWYVEKLSNPEAAEHRLRKALALDPESGDAMADLEQILRRPGREKDLVDLLRKRADIELDYQVKKDRLLEAARLAEAVLRDVAVVEQTYRALLEIDENEPRALDALAAIAETKGDESEAAELLLRRARTSDDPRLAKELRHRVAKLQAGPMKDVDAALATYREILDQDPDDRGAMTALEGHYESLGRWVDLKEALAHRLAIVETSDDRVAVLLRLARVSEERFDSADDALDSLREALTLAPSNAEVSGQMERLLVSTERWSDLVDFLEDRAGAAAKGGDAARELGALVRIGEIREEKMGDVDRAVEIYDRVLERDPRHVRALSALARLHEKSGDWDRCVAALEKAAELPADPADAAEVLFRLGRVENDRRSNPAKAREHFALALEKWPTHQEALAALKALTALAKDDAKLVELLLFEEAQTKAPKEKAAILREIAKLYSGPLAAPALAVPALEKAAAIEPADRDLSLQLVDAYDAAGRHRDAVPVLKKLVAAAGTSRGKDLAQIHHRLGRALEAMGDTAGALAEFERAQKIDLTNVSMLRDLAKLAHKLADMERAQKTFRALLLQKLDEKAGITKSEVYWFLGDILEKSGDAKKALSMFERGLEADRTSAANREAIERLRGHAPGL